MKESTAPAPLTESELHGWFAGRLPEKLFAGPPTITSDRDEILVVGDIEEPELPKDAGEGPRAPGGAKGPRRSRRARREIRAHQPLPRRDQGRPDPGRP